MNHPTNVNVARLIDESSISRFQYRILAICLLIMVLDGFDTQAIAYAAPGIVEQWKLDPATLGPIFAVALLGSMVGAFVFGRLADSFGRKWTLAICVTIFGTLNFATAFATSVQEFAILRFLCGLGLGGSVPNIMAMISEYMPARRRLTFLTMAWAGFGAGGAIGGIISVPLMAHLGWQAVFIAGGVLPLLLVPFILALFPESIKFLVLAGGKGSKVAAILGKIVPHSRFDAASRFILDEVHPPRGRFLALFRNGLAVGSIFLCMATAMNLFLTYLLLNWIPLLLRQAGISIERALMGTVVFNIAGLMGGLFLAQLIDRKIARPVIVLSTASLLGATAVYSISHAGMTFWLLMVTIFASGFFINGSLFSLGAFVANYYPTSIRGTGVGWSQIIGRLGSLAGPLVGGILVAKGMETRQFFQVVAIAPLVACVLLLIFLKLSPRLKESQS